MMRWASPSTIAVLPTPGSPIRTGLFFVRRLSTWMTRRISSSRPMTGSSRPSRAASVRSRPNFSSAWNLSSGDWSVTRCEPRTSASACSSALARRADGAQRLAGGAVVAGDREQQVLDGDVLVLELAHLALGGAQHGHELGGRRRLGLARERGEGVERGVDVGAQHVGRGAELAQDGRDERRRPAPRAGRRADVRGRPARGAGSARA